jgi:hypothetical protein
MADEFGEPSRWATPCFGPDAMTFAQSDGLARLTAKVGGVLPVMYRPVTIQDFVVVADLHVPNPRRFSGYGLILRSDDRRDAMHWYYALNLYPKLQQIGLQCWRDGRWDDGDQPQPFPEGAYQAGKFNRLRVEVVGPRIRVFLNDRFVGDFSGKAIQRDGLVGISLSCADVPDELLVDNFRVYELQPR